MARTPAPSWRPGLGTPLSGNSPLMVLPDPPVPLPLGSPPWMTKPGA